MEQLKEVVFTSKFRFILWVILALTVKLFRYLNKYALQILIVILSVSIIALNIFVFTMLKNPNMF